MPPRPRTARVSPTRRPRVAGLTTTARKPDRPPRSSAEDDAHAELVEATADPAGGTAALDSAQAADGAEPEAPRSAGGDLPGEAAQTGRTAAAGGLRGRAVPVLATALVVLIAAAVFFGVQDAQRRATPAALNTALVDVGGTAEASAQLSDAIETVYSFDFARLDENENAAREVITPAFAAEFDRLFAEVRKRAPEQQAVVSATVTMSAVKELTEDRAVLVAFVDQLATRAAPDAEAQQLTAAGRLTVTGERVDGRWKIAAVTPL